MPRLGLFCIAASISLVTAGGQCKAPGLPSNGPWLGKQYSMPNGGDRSSMQPVNPLHPATSGSGAAATSSSGLAPPPVIAAAAPTSSSSTSSVKPVNSSSTSSLVQLAPVAASSAGRTLPVEPPANRVKAASTLATRQSAQSQAAMVSSSATALAASANPVPASGGGGSNTVCLASSTASRITGPTSLAITPHSQFSSSLGLVGCMVNTSRMAYWPECIDTCRGSCYKVTHGSRSVYLLHADNSGGAHDISAEAMIYLTDGTTPSQPNHLQSGPVTMQVEPADFSQCTYILKDSKFWMSALHPTAYTDCIGHSDAGTFMLDNAGFLNIDDPTALTSGTMDDTCKWDDASAGVTCGKGLGAANAIQPLQGSCSYTNYVYPTVDGQPMQATVIPAAKK